MILLTADDDAQTSSCPRCPIPHALSLPLASSLSLCLLPHTIFALSLYLNRSGLVLDCCLCSDR